MTNLTPLKDCINFLLTGAQHTVFQIMKRDLDRFDLTPIQYGVLKCIWEYGIQNPKEIAEILGIENSTISGILERMEKKQLITREIDDNDRRFIRICLTDKSRKLEKPVNEVVDQVNNKVLSQFSDEEIAQIHEFLRKIDEISA